MNEIITLNLIDSKKSDMGYSLVGFPDGQQSIILIDTQSSPKPIRIITSLQNFDDVELLLCSTSALRNLGYTDIQLNIKYLIGARSDRVFGEGHPHYLRDVIAPIINSQGYSKVYVLDPHSDVVEALIDNFKPWPTPVNYLIFKALQMIDNKTDARERLVIVSPDAGALKKIYVPVKKYRIPYLVIASKHRNTLTGEITHTEVPGLEKYNKNMNYLIIDDICDGGRTFIEIAKVIKEKFPKANIYLVVTHGIFSQGLKPFVGLFKQIFTTDSIRNINNINDEFVMHNERYMHLLTQIDV